MIEVRREEDDELCGYVHEQHGVWSALTVFRGVLGVHSDGDDARRQVLEAGLAVLIDRWTLVDVAAATEQVVCIQEASPDEIRLALDYYSMPGVPTLTLSTDELTAGRWRLEHRS